MTIDDTLAAELRTALTEARTTFQANVDFLRSKPRRPEVKRSVEDAQIRLRERIELLERLFGERSTLF